MFAALRVPRNLLELSMLAAAGDAEAVGSELLELSRRARGRWGFERKAAGALLRAQPAELRIGIVRALVARPPGTADVDDVLLLLLQHGHTDLPPDLDLPLLTWVARSSSGLLFGHLVPVARRVAGRGEGLPAEVVAAIRRLAITHAWNKGPLQQLVTQLRDPILNPGEAWADQVLADLPRLGEGWAELVRHTLTATAAKPTATWERRAGALLDALGPERARHVIAGWLAHVGRRPSLRPDPHSGNAPADDTNTAGRPTPTSDTPPPTDDGFDPFNAIALRGLAWLLALAPPHVESARALARLVETALRKVPDFGVRSPRVANAAAYALSRMAGEAALAQLAWLATRVTYKPTLKEIEAALDTRAAAQGLSRAEAEELATPTYSLTEVGRRVVRFGDATAELTVTGGHATLAWCNAAGKPVKAAPASVRRDFAGELRELKAAVKDLDKMLTVVSERLDRQALRRRTWSFAAWRAAYLDHPVAGTVARRLIWLIGGVPCGFAGGALRAIDGIVQSPPDDAVVELWHPIGRGVPEVLGWREWLERHGIVQPFKQAHREVYPLTAAEERTAVYSNRYAAHILRQHQFHALATTRGWRNKLRLMVDDDYPPAMRELPEWGLRAEFWVEGVGDDWDADVNESGTFLRVATDQVRFYPLAAPENRAPATGGGYEQWVPAADEVVRPLPLTDIPPLVFSEVMRDIDLFVGVTSVGNDPTWQDGGPQGRFREYWEAYSFGELSATAQTRRDLLARLVPRLAIADRCTLEGRFLVVRGDLRTYRIHLGSGNILMSPNNQYLCIVPSQAPQATPGQLFLPFEGDRMLAVILSKAMLLARDTAITDRSITSQIRRA
jgi:hypothetical protein